VNRSGGHRPLTGIRTNLALVSFLVLAAACNSAPGSSDTPDDEGTGGRATGAGGNKPSGSGGAGGKGMPAGKGGTMGSSQGGSADGGSPGAGGGGGSPGKTDAGSPEGDDAAPADAPPADAPAMPAGCTGKFCDDFEGYTGTGAPGGDWTVHLEKGMLAMDSTKAFSGARSVHFTHAGAPAAMFIELRKPLLPLAGTVVYGRLMYYLVKNPTGQYAHFELVRGTGPLPGGEQAQLNTGAENGKVVINYEPGDCTKYSKVPFPEKKWTCYQWRFDLAKNDVHEWVDNISADDVPVAPAGTCWKSPMVLDALHIGWESYHGNMPVELWIDDVAVGDQPIPCPTGMPSKP
jgi:hypothetical protein